MWVQREIALLPRQRGFHLITEEIERQLPELNDMALGVAHLFILHTSASLSISENADPSVRSDMEAYFNQLIPENEPYYRHVQEGADDMPAHLKAICIGTDLTIPVAAGRFCLGTWQGIYLGEHRDQGGSRRLVVTLNGQGDD